ncbi:thioredoxin [Halogranum tailed virus 1]|uniref:Thioredoxin n=1 Tax=Halogranum tailed virus 1 TaxID=1273749 RepID=R4TGT4_9CAUD|nr:thioredoxin [Halogranum tailed virus 1]AGM11471.1 thioredoxin [Halogranum tailed virus 1]
MTIKVLQFTAEWCGPCESQHPIIDRVEDELDVEVERVDVDEHQGVANNYNVRGIPFIVVEEDGTVRDSFQGLTQFESIEASVESIRNS